MFQCIFLFPIYFSMFSIDFNDSKLTMFTMLRCFQSHCHRHSESTGVNWGHSKGHRVKPSHWIDVWTHLYLIRRWICMVDWVSRLFPDWVTTWLTVHVTDFFESSRDYNFYSKWVPLNINSICYILYTKWRVLIYTIYIIYNILFLMMNIWPIGRHIREKP